MNKEILGVLKLASTSRRILQRQTLKLRKTELQAKATNICINLLSEKTQIEMS